jgi:glycosyltransferase involved in cell wall biosynthesis
MRYLSALRHRRRGRPVEAVPALLELARSGPAQLSQDARDEQAPLHIATVIPSFRRGSGGHATIVNLLRELRALGHSVSVWLEDVEGRHASEQEAVTKRAFSEFYRADGLDLQTGFQAWRGADVVLATGWQTVARALLLPGAGARAYLVQDHEPEFYGTSAQSLWAAWTYRQGLHCIAASRWLAELLHARYDASTSHFDLAVDHAVYGAADEPRRDDLVVFYARDATPRRAVPLGLLALNELSRRRPNVELCLYGEGAPLQAPFTHRHLGVLDAARLAQLYRRAAVGMVLSLTNPSLVSLEMVASGLPCVELASESMLSEFGAQGPLTLSEADPLALCTALDGLLADPGRRTSAARAGLELVGERTWARAAVQVQAGLRRALQMAANPSGREPTRSPLQP